MTKFEIYSLFLCLIVFIMLVGLFSYMLTIIIKNGLKHIKAGLEDEDILKEFNIDYTKKRSKFSKVFNILLCAIVGVIFLSSIYINCTQNIYFDNAPTFRVVLTSSMESKNEKNKYLFDNNLNNQISAFDLITTYKIPSEEDLKLYDIVVYEVDGILIVHRIVGIEEPNTYHPNEKYFLMQGDAVGSPDRFPVLYSQMKGIYKGEKIPFIGSFVLFVQSPAGWLCLLLIVGAMICTPILEKKLLNARKERFLLLSQQQELATTKDFNESVDSRFANLKPSKTFNERLTLASEKMQNRYTTIVQTLSRIENLRIIESKMQQTYKSKSCCIARIFFRGKTLNVALGLSPKDYENSKYKFIDLSNRLKYKNYPMCLRLSSDRQTRWTCELILDLAKKKGLNILNKPTQFTRLNIKKKSFKQKLKLSPIAKERFINIKTYLETINGVRTLEGEYQTTYKLKNLPIVKFAIKGKTLNAYLGLNPKDYVNTKYIFTDVSDIKKYSNYTMRVKVSSDRQVKWVKELIQKIIQR